MPLVCRLYQAAERRRQGGRRIAQLSVAERLESVAVEEFLRVSVKDALHRLCGYAARDEDIRETRQVAYAAYAVGS